MSLDDPHSGYSGETGHGVREERCARCQGEFKSWDLEYLPGIGRVCSECFALVNDEDA